MLSALGVINGYTDGSFKPNDTVTRAEMAKMIFTIMNGGKDNADSYASLPTAFTDLASAGWAQGYIRYLQNTGIIAGKSATKFAPNDTVTGLEAAKMVLVAAGYNAQKAGLTGVTWAQNTMKYGQLNNLFEDVDTDLNAALPRQYAAQILYNALDMERVVWSNDIEDFKPATDVDDDKTIGGKYMDLVKTDAAQLLSVEKTSGKDTYEITLGKDVKYGDDTTPKSKFDKVATDVSDLIGLNVKVLVKAKSNGNTDVYGVYADDDSKVIATGTVGQLDTVTGETKKFKLNDTEYKADDVLTDSTKVQVIFPNKEDVTPAINTLKKAIDARANYAAYSIKLIDNNGNNKVDTVVIVPAKVAKVTYVGSSAATIGGKSYKFDDVDIYDGVKKDDWAVIVEGDYVASGDPVITKATVVSGKVEGTKSGEVKINGTWYKLAGKVDTHEVDDEIDAVVVGNYVYNTEVTGESSKSIVFISATKDADTNLSKDVTVEARGYFMDGTNKKIVVDKLNGNNIDKNLKANDTSLLNKLFTYTTDKDGNYELKAVATTNLAGYDNYVGTTNTTPGTSGASFTGTDYADKRIKGTLIAEDAVLFVAAQDEIKVISGKTARDWAKDVAVKNEGFLTKESNGIDYVKVAALSTDAKKVANADGDLMYAYLTEDAYETKKDGDTVTAFKAVVGNSTEATTLYDDASTYKSAKAGNVIVYTVDGDEITVKAVVTSSYAKNNGKNYFDGAYAIKGFDGKKKGDMSLVKADGSTVNTTLDEDCVFIGVDDKKNVGTVSDIAAVPTSADKDEFDRYKKNAYVIFNDKDKVVAVVYDTEKNELNLGDDVKTATAADEQTITMTKLTNLTIAGEETAKVEKVEASVNKSKPVAKVTLTATLSGAIAGKDTTVVVNDKTVGNVTITVKAGETTGTAAFTMPNSTVEFTFVSATATAAK